MQVSKNTLKVGLKTQNKLILTEKMVEIEWIKFLLCAPPPSLILKALRKREKWEKLTPEIPFLASFKIKKVYFCQCCPHAHKNCVSKETPTTVKVPGHNGAKIFTICIHCFFMHFNNFIIILLYPSLLVHFCWYVFFDWFLWESLEAFL